MIGWILYQEEDLEKNQWWIKHLQQLFAKRDISLKLAQTITDIDTVDFIINRTREYHYAEFFENQNVRVFNNAEVNNLANDKYLTYMKATSLGIPVLKSEILTSGWLPETTTYPFVLKSIGGHGGKEVFWVEDKKKWNTLSSIIEPEKWLIQEAASVFGQDLRVYIIGNQIQVGMLRTSMVDFRCNYSLGGKAEPAAIPNDVKNIITTLTDRYSFDYVGIDFLQHHNQYVLNEIEDPVGSRMVYEKTNIDLGERLVQWIVDSMQDYKK